MSERTPQIFLQDILDSGESIQSYLQGITFEQFERERMRHSAVIREFEIIGEAETAEENLAELTAQADTFAEKQLPILKALGIA